jgi:sugar phosphate isomerase/epimerase
MKTLTRRDCLAGAAALAAAKPSAAAPGAPLKLSVFSKHFQWTGWDEMSSIAKQVGFDGMDITVRPGGHVLPERVEDDLPKCVEVIRKTGLAVEMVTAGIVDCTSPHAEKVLRTLNQLGIKYYRWGGFKYANDKSVAAQLAELAPKVKDLAAMNAHHKVTAMYHTHSGAGQLGAHIWDVWYLVKDLDTRWIGINYDIGHQTVEGGLGGWIDAARVSQPMMHGIALKDFRWEKKANGEWAPFWCAPGEGMVKFPQFFSMIKAAKFGGPVQVHYEYPELGGANNGATKMSIPKEKFISILSRDLNYIRGLMKQAQLIA